MANKFLINCNSNIVCAVDCEVTGPIAGEDDLIQICVLPLNSELQPNLNIQPFDVCLQPKRPENYPLHDTRRMRGRPSKERFCEANTKGLDPYLAAELFDDWFRKLQLGYEKRIIPLAHNWPFDYQFVCDWLGHQSAEQYFDARYRDTQATAAYLNDCAEFHVEPIPHAKLQLSYIASIYRIPHDRKHDALSDCIVTAQVYREIIRRSLFHIKPEDPPKTPPDILNDLRSQIQIDENKKYAMENYQEGTLSYYLAELGYKPESENHAKEILHRIVLEKDWYQKNI